ncbi:MAG: ROK family protein [Mycobacteriaceae bacterium]
MVLATAAQPSPRRSLIRVVAPQLGVAEQPAAAVLRAVRSDGPASRDLVARRTGLSAATVNRQITTLISAGLIRERPDLTPSGSVGRPRVPLEIDHERYLTLGVHIGARVTSIVVSDLRGRMLGCVEVPTPGGGAVNALRSLASSAARFGSRWHSRRALWVGVAIGGRVDPAAGTVDHPRLGWTSAPVAEVLSTALGIPASVAAHVEAMAAAELLITGSEGDRPPASVLYVYGRETVGAVLAIDGRVHTPSMGAGSISHLPAGASQDCACGKRGCLESAVSDSAVVESARGRGLISADEASAGVSAVQRAAAAGSAAAQELLVERAETLGRAVALLRDLLNPDRIILGGQAFTDYTAGLPHVARAVAAHSPLSSTDIRVSAFGARVQHAAASTVSLSALYSDPVASMRKAS